MGDDYEVDSSEARKKREGEEAGEKTADRPPVKTRKQVFKGSLAGKNFVDQQRLLSPDTSPVLPSNLPDEKGEVPDGISGGVSIPVDQALSPPGAVLASPGQTVAGPTKTPATKAAPGMLTQNTAAAYLTPALPTTVKKWSRGNENYKTTGYLYKAPLGGSALFATAGKKAAQTKASPTAGIEFTDPKQNMLEECYLVAGLSAIAKTHPAVIKNAIKPVKAGKQIRYQVTLYEKNQKAWVKKSVTVDPQPLYAKVAGSRKVGKQTQTLYLLRVMKGKAAVAESNNFIPLAYKPTATGVVRKGVGTWFDADMDGVQYRLSADGSGKADLQSAQSATTTPVAKWPYTYKLSKDGQMRTGVEAVSTDTATGTSINELWPVVIEKAVALALGGYEKLFSQRTAAQAGAVLSMLTGKDSETTRLKGSQATLKKKIIAYHTARQPMIALCKTKNAKLGLEGSHYYTVTDITRLGADDIMDVSLRDPRAGAGKFGSDGEGDVSWAVFYKHFTWVVAGKV